MGRSCIGLAAVVALGLVACVAMGQATRRAPRPRPSLDSPVQAKDEAEKKILDVLDDMRKGQAAGMMNVPIEDGRMLRLLTESTGAKHVVEIGTSNGYSAIWMCLALRTTGGKLTTHEIDAERAALARQNFKRAGVDTIVTLVEGDAHKEVSKLKEPIDILFLDADKEGYLDYLNKLLPLVRPGGLVIAHNMSPGMADADYVKAITTNPQLETLFIRSPGAGMGITMKKRSTTSAVADASWQLYRAASDAAAAQRRPDAALLRSLEEAAQTKYDVGQVITYLQKRGAEADAARAEVAQLQDQLKKTRDALEAARMALTISPAPEVSPAAAQTQLEAAKQANAQLTADLEKANKRASEAEKQTADLTTQLKAAQDRIDQLAKEIEKLKKPPA